MMSGLLAMTEMMSLSHVHTLTINWLLSGAIMWEANNVPLEQITLSLQCAVDTQSFLYDFEECNSNILSLRHRKLQASLTAQILYCFQ